MRFLLMFVTVVSFAWTSYAGLGESCYGFAGILCHPDLVCMPIQNPHPIDGAGICVWK